MVDLFGDRAKGNHPKWCFVEVFFLGEIRYLDKSLTAMYSRKALASGLIQRQNLGIELERTAS